MTIQQAILTARESSGKIRNKRWLPEIYHFVENGFVRQEHNETCTGKPTQFDIDLLLSDEWEVVEGSSCPYCQNFIHK